MKEFFILEDLLDARREIVDYARRKGLVRRGITDDGVEGIKVARRGCIWIFTLSWTLALALRGTLDRCM